MSCARVRNLTGGALDPETVTKSLQKVLKILGHHTITITADLNERVMTGATRQAAAQMDVMPGTPVVRLARLEH